MTSDNDIRNGVMAVLALLCMIVAFIAGSSVTYGILRIINAPTIMWVVWAVSVLLAGFGIMLSAFFRT